MANLFRRRLGRIIGLAGMNQKNEKLIRYADQINIALVFRNDRFGRGVITSTQPEIHLQCFCWLWRLFQPSILYDPTS
jgi:hypothetical protein